MVGRQGQEKLLIPWPGSKRERKRLGSHYPPQEHTLNDQKSLPKAPPLKVPLPSNGTMGWGPWSHLPDPQQQSFVDIVQHLVLCTPLSAEAGMFAQHPGSSKGGLVLGHSCGLSVTGAGRFSPLVTPRSAVPLLVLVPLRLRVPHATFLPPIAPSIHNCSCGWNPGGWRRQGAAERRPPLALLASPGSAGLPWLCCPLGWNHLWLILRHARQVDQPESMYCPGPFPVAGGRGRVLRRTGRTWADPPAVSAPLTTETPR